MLSLAIGNWKLATELLPEAVVLEMFKHMTTSTFLDIDLTCQLLKVTLKHILCSHSSDWNFHSDSWQLPQRKFGVVDLRAAFFHGVRPTVSNS